MNQLKYYQEANDLNFNKLIAPVLVSLACAIILGFLYAVLVYFIPFPYVTFFMAIGLAMAIGFCSRLTLRFFKITGKKNHILLLIVMVFFTYYFHWVAYLILFFEEGGLSITGYIYSLPWMLFPDFSFFNAINLLATAGAWSMFGIIFSGIALVIVWILEFAIIAAIAIKTGLNSNVIPFSYKFNKWYPKFTLTDQFEHVASIKYIESQIKDTNVLDFINKLDQGQGFAFSRIHIYFNKQEHDQYLTFEKVNVESRGEGKTNVTPMVQHLRISTIEAESILQKHNNKLERFDLF